MSATSVYNFNKETEELIQKKLIQYYNIYSKNKRFDIKENIDKTKISLYVLLSKRRKRKEIEKILRYVRL